MGMGETSTDSPLALILLPIFGFIFLVYLILYMITWILLHYYFKFFLVLFSVLSIITGVLMSALLEKAVDFLMFFSRGAVVIYIGISFYYSKRKLKNTLFKNDKLPFLETYGFYVVLIGLGGALSAELAFLYF